MININAFKNIISTYSYIIKNIFFSPDKKISAFNKECGTIIYWYFWASKSIQLFGFKGYSLIRNMGQKNSDFFSLSYFGYGLPLKLLKTALNFYKTSILFLIIVVFGLAIIEKNYYFFFFSFFFFASPAFIFGFIHIPKPENLAMPFFLIMLYAIINEQIIFAGCFYLIITFMNIPLFVFSSSFIFLLFLFRIILINQYIMITIIPALYIVLILLQWYRNINIKRFFGGLGASAINSEHNTKQIIINFLKGVNKNWKIQGEMLIWVSLTVLLGTLVYFENIYGKEVFICLITIYILTIFVSYFIFRFIDPHFFIRILFLITIAANLIELKLSILLMSVFFLYLENNLFYAMGAINLSYLKNSDYPYLIKHSVLTDKFDDTMNALVDKIKEKERVLLEIDSFANHIIPDIRQIIHLFSYKFSEKLIAIIPDEFFCQSNEKYENKLVLLNSQSNVDKIIEIMDDLGANYIIGYTKKFIDSLENSGKFEFLGEIANSDISDVLLNIPENKSANKFCFYKLKISTEIILNSISHKIEKNKINIQAERCKEVILKYTYHRDWKVNKGDAVLKKFNYCGLDYMKLKFNQGNDCELIFKG